MRPTLRKHRYSVVRKKRGFPWTGLIAAIGFATYRVLRKRPHPIRRAGPTTPSTMSMHAADARIGPPGDNLDERLDEALQESFPTSDPVSIQIA